MGEHSATVILPTHDHAATLPYSIESVLGQTHDDLRLVVIGDGVGADTRAIVEDAMRRDERVSFLDRPKTPRHGEPLRDEVIRNVDSAVIAYQGDDDLWLPDHLETMIRCVDEHGADFVHPLPIFVAASGGIFHLPADLSWPRFVGWQLSGPLRNAISLTGVAHTRDSYLRLPWGWRTTPSDRWTDDYMWEQYLALDGLTPYTSGAATTIKFSPVGREGRSPAERADEIAEWAERVTSDGFRAEWTDRVHRAVRAAAVERLLEAADHEDQVAQLRAEAAQHIAELEAQTESLGERARLAAEERDRLELATGALKDLLDTTRAQRDVALRRVDTIERSTTWRMTAPARQAIDRLRRRPRRQR